MQTRGKVQRGATSPTGTPSDDGAREMSAEPQPRGPRARAAADADRPGQQDGGGGSGAPEGGDSDDDVAALLLQYTLLLGEAGLLAGGAAPSEAAARGLVARLRPRLAAAPALRRLEGRGPGGAAAVAAAAPAGGGAAEAAEAAAGGADAPNAAAEAPPRSGQRLQLQLRHSCRSTACGSLSCPLCKFNPIQPCGSSSLAARYLADDPLRAPCGAPIHVALEAPGGGGGGEALQQQLGAAAVEVIVIDGERYDGLMPAAASRAGGLPLPFDAILAACAVERPPTAAKGPLLKAEASTALLALGGAGGSPRGGGAGADGGGDDGERGVGGAEDRLVLLPQGGVVSLSGLRCCASSEAVLQGKGCRFRLAVRAVDAATGAPLEHVGAAVSDPFLVATRRMKQALKRDIPCTADEVGRLRHIGRATTEKLRRLAAAADAEGVALGLPPGLAHVERVGQFGALAEHVSGDPGARMRLLALLKLSSANWAEAVAHAAAAVPPDGRRRAFTGGPGARGVTLLFEARMGALLGDEGPAAVVYADGGEALASAADPRLAPLLPGLKAAALAAWRAPGHPGWSVWGADGTTGALGGGGAGGGAPLAAGGPLVSGGLPRSVSLPAHAAAQAEGQRALQRHASAAATQQQAALLAQQQEEAQQLRRQHQQEQAAQAAQAAQQHALRLQAQQQVQAAAAAAAEAAVQVAEAAAARAAAQARAQAQAQAAQQHTGAAQAARELDEHLKRARSETAERRAAAMADARARLLQLRAGGGGGIGGAPAGSPSGSDDADVEFEAPAAPGGGGGGAASEAERAALQSMYEEWQAAPAGRAASLARLIARPLSIVPVAYQRPTPAAASAAAPGLPLSGGGVGLLPSEVDELLAEIDGDVSKAGGAAAAAQAAAAAAAASAPLLAQGVGAGGAAAAGAELVRSLSDPRGLAVSGEGPDPFEGAPWLVGSRDAAEGLDRAELLCRSLRDMSFGIM
ncbi:MAG: hypothetical protein J3K34DRAFT_526676 [Monoraphidium minutum]|nr:MAG: hypothetical protein J3K34DRAFT_526676 [Monoraphidium minutum]